MTQSLLKSRLLASAQSAPEQLQPDFEAQYTEFVTIAQSILYSDIGYLAIAQSLDEALGLLEESLASKHEIISLPLKSIDALIGNLCPLIPILLVIYILTDYAQFSIEQANTIADWNVLTGNHIIAANQIWRFTACHLQSRILNIVLPRLSFREFYQLSFSNPPIINLFIEWTVISAEPCLIYKIILAITNPS